MSHTRYFVYVVTNAVNDKRYVGMTSKPAIRLLQHSYRGAMRADIARHGIDCFTLTVLSVHENRADALSEEQAQIVAQRSHIPNGYNRRMRGGRYPGCGGAGSQNKNSRRVECVAYYPDGHEAFRFPTVLDASKSLGIARNTIHRCFRFPEYRAGGYHWKRENA